MYTAEQFHIGLEFDLIEIVSQGHCILVDERTESEFEVARDVPHGAGQLFAQRFQLHHIIFHRIGQIHEKVQIDRIVFGLLELHREIVHLSYRKTTKFTIGQIILNEIVQSQKLLISRLFILKFTEEKIKLPKRF